MKRSVPINKWKRVIAGLLVLCLAVLPPVSALGAAYDSDKEEIIYVMTDEAGKVRTMRAVNVFGPGTVEDYGNYTDAQMMNTNDEISLHGDQARFTTEASRAYYEGFMADDSELPWNINLSADIDGKTVPMDALGGQSGHLILYLQITKNTACIGNWYDTYALQVTLQLDTSRCSNMIAGDATIANVGLKKQLTYTVLPGKGLDTIVEADVTDFTMDGLSINGICLNLDVDFDDAQLMDKVRELMDASVSLRDGAQEIYDGSLDLREGATDITQGTRELDDGARRLHEGAAELEDGIQKVRDGIQELNHKSGDLVKGSSEVKEALGKIQDGLSQVEMDKEEINRLADASGEVYSGITRLNEAVEELEQAVNYTAYEQRINDGLAPYDMTLTGLQDANTRLADSIQTISDTINGEQVQETLDNANALLGRLEENPLYTSGSGLRFLMGAKDAMQSVENILKRVNSVSGQAAGVLNLNNGVIKGTETYLNEVNKNLIVLQENTAKLEKSYAEFHGAILDMRVKLLELADGMTELKEGVDTLVTEYRKLDDGIGEYTNGVKDLEEGYRDLVKGAADLTRGCKDLLEGADALQKGAEDLLNGVMDLADGTGELADGTSVLQNETGNMDQKVQQEIDEALGGFTGGNGEPPMSFTSSKNGSVKSLQFVIRTASVNLPAEEMEPVAAAVKLTWWQKLLKLFGLWK